MLDPLGVQLAILSCDYGVESVRNPDAAAALAAAVNDWQLAEWLEPEPRLRAAIVVAAQQPAAALAELERCAGDPRSSPCSCRCDPRPRTGTASGGLYSRRRAQELVAELHFGGSPGIPPTAAGWPTSWLEEYVDMTSAFESELTSLIAEGTWTVSHRCGSR